MAEGFFCCLSNRVLLKYKANMKHKIVAITMSLSLGLLLFPGISQAVSVSQTSVSLQVGQTTNITVTTPFGQTPNVFGNTNTTVATAFMSGNNLNIQGVSNGTTNVRVCTNGVDCATVFVTITGFGNSFPPPFFPSNQITFSQSNLMLGISQIQTVSVFNNSGSLFVSNNSNSNIVTPTVLGSSIRLFGRQAGFSTLTICSSGFSQCGSLFVTVTGSSTGQINFSETNVSLLNNETRLVSIFNNTGGNFFISSNSNPNTVIGTLSFNSISLFGRENGNSTITVCSGNQSQCGSLFVTVSQSGFGQVGFSQNNLILQPLDTRLITVFTTSSQSLFINSNSNSISATATLSGNILSIKAYTPGQSSITVCSGNFNLCGVLNVTVTEPGVFVPSPTPPVLIPPSSPPGTVLGTSIYLNGTLVKDGNTIYITYKNLKSGFANMTAFRGLGYQTSNLVSGSTASLVNSNFVIGSSDIAHPWGSWIKSGTTVYFVHQSGLIPIADHSVFLNNGGQDRLVIEANSRDFLNKQFLSIMGLNDSRLR
jgi:hypothetical protein